MTSPGLETRRFRCGPFLVEPFYYRIVSSGGAVTLEPKVMELLVYLLERQGRVVSKASILAGVWNDRFVGDGVVSVAVHQIRRAFGDDARTPSYLETVPRRGYRWMVPVTPIVGREHPRFAPRESRRRWRWSALVAASVLVLIVLGRVRETPVTTTVETLTAYQRGLYYWDRRRAETLERARVSFEKAIALDSGFAPAWAGLAETLSLSVDLGLVSRVGLAAKARAHAATAVALDPTSHEAWTSMAMIRLVWDLDVEAAELDVRRAFQLAPDYARAHQVNAWLLSARGDHAAAMAAAARACALDPVAVSPRLDLAFIAILAGRYQAAVAAANDALALDGDHPAAYAAMGRAYDLSGQPRRAFEAFRASMERTGHPDEELDALAKRYGRDGLAGVYRDWLRNGRVGSSWTSRARWHVALGEIEDAFDCLERAVSDRDSALLWVRSDPGFRAIASHPRFEALFARLGP